MMDHVGDFVTLITTLSTFLTALASLAVIIEMRQQRKSSYKPDLIAVTQFFDASKSPLEDSVIPTCWRTREKDSSASEKVHSSHRSSFMIEIYNVGNGVAKDISFKWSYPISTLVDSVNSLAQDQIVKINSRSNWLMFDSYKYDNSKFRINLNSTSSYNENYLIPSSISHSPARIPVPFCYIRLVSTYVALCELNEPPSNTGDIRELPLNIPDINLNISFKDMDGAIIQRDFNFNLALISLSFKDNKLYESFCAEFKASVV